MLNQLDPITVLTKFNKIAEAGKEIVATDIPPSEIVTMMDLALKAKALPVSSAAIVPPLINPNSPNFELVRSTVQQRIEASEATDNPTAEPTSAATPETTPKPKSKASPTRDAQTDDLSKVCAA
jgi:cell wall-associated NlpC family hydrolase